MRPLTVKKGKIVKYRNFSHGMSDFACKMKSAFTLDNLAEIAWTMLVQAGGLDKPSTLLLVRVNTLNTG